MKIVDIKKNEKKLAYSSNSPNKWLSQRGEKVKKGGEIFLFVYKTEVLLTFSAEEIAF
jgi:hypothetical protein